LLINPINQRNLLAGWGKLLAGSPRGRFIRKLKQIKNMAKEYNLAAIVVFIALVEGLAIYVNMVAHPELQPVLTAVIAIIAAVANGLVAWYLPK
jgi:hypothetical protein